MIDMTEFEEKLIGILEDIAYELTKIRRSQE
jgi:hypothetical protein